MAQNFRNQEGISIGGGTSSLGRYSGVLRTEHEPGTSQYQAFSWEGSFLRIRRLNDKLAFSHGLSLLMLGHSFQRDRQIWNPGNSDTLWFESNRQRLESYYVSFPFRWSFYLNQHSSGRFFLGPGFILAIPVYQIQRIRGNDRNGNYQEVSERRFPEKGPYAFLCPEFETGYLAEFPDCSLARFSLFFSLRAPGIFKDEGNYALQSFSGLRFAWFFGND